MPRIADDDTMSFTEIAQMLEVSVMTVHHWSSRSTLKRPRLARTMKWLPRRRRWGHAVRVDVLDTFLALYRPKLRYKLQAKRDASEALDHG